MKNRYLFFNFLVFSFLVAVVPACKKEAIDDTDHGYPIQLTVEKPGRNIVLNWTGTKISDFEKYIVVRSTAPIPDSPTPPSASIVNIDDYDITNFEDSAFPLADTLYYKVYAKIGDRFLYSPSVQLATNFNLFDINPSRIVFDVKNHLVYLHDVNKATLFKYNYDTEKMVDTLSVSNAFDSRLAIGNNGAGNELYIANNNSFAIEIYDADNLTYKTSINVGEYIFSIASGNNDLLYAATNGWAKSFAIYQRSTKQLKGTNSDFDGLGDTNVGVISDDGLSVVQAGFNPVQRYTISPQGAILNEVTNSFSNNFTSIIQDMVISPNGEFFIPHLAGSVFSKDMAFIGSLSGNDFKNFSDFAFSKNIDKIWALNLAPSELQEFSFPTLKLNQSTSLGYFPLRTVRDGNQLIIVGSVSDGLSIGRTYIDKIQVQ